jgi:hypothetical protein
MFACDTKKKHICKAEFSHNNFLIQENNLGPSLLQQRISIHKKQHTRESEKKKDINNFGFYPLTPNVLMVAKSINITNRMVETLDHLAQHW